MEKFSYRGINRIKELISPITGIIGISIFTSLALLLLINMNKIQITSSNSSIMQNPRVSLLCIVIGIIAISWLIGFIFINFHPNIWIYDDGLVISSFIFFSSFIPWKNIIDIKSGHFLYGSVLVRVKKLNPFYRIYGLIYTYTLVPAFLVGKNIENREKLIGMIREQITH